MAATLKFIDYNVAMTFILIIIIIIDLAWFSSLSSKRLCVFGLIGAM